MTRTKTVAEILVAHELHPTCTERGRTMWTCRTCPDVSVDASVRHSVAQAEHQAAQLTKRKARSAA